MSSCNKSLPAFNELDACTIERGKIVALALIDQSIEFDSTSPIDEDESWNQGVYSGDIVIFKKVNGSYSPPSAVETTAKGSRKNKVVGADHEITVNVNGLKGNSNFMSKLNKADNYKLAFIYGTAKDRIGYINQPVSIMAGPNIPSDTESESDWQLTFKWSNIEVPEFTNAPPTTFDE